MKKRFLNVCLFEVMYLELMWTRPMVKILNNIDLEE